MKSPRKRKITFWTISGSVLGFAVGGPFFYFGMFLLVISTATGPPNTEGTVAGFTTGVLLISIALLILALYVWTLNRYSNLDKETKTHDPTT